MGAPAAPLTPFEVAVRGGRAALSRAELVGIHGKAHGTSRKPPLEPGLRENLRETLFLGLGPHKAGPRHDHCPHPLLDLLALQDLGRSAQVLDAAVGA